MVRQEEEEKDDQYIHRFCARHRQLIKKHVPSDVDPHDAVVLVRILRSQTNTRFRLVRNCKNFWSDIIRWCHPVTGKITQLVISGFDKSICRTPLSLSNGNSDLPPGPNLLSRLDKLERLELRDCRSLPLTDLQAMKSLKWLNVCILENFLMPQNRDWYPPNLKTFLIYGYKVNGDPLDALIATSIIIRLPLFDFSESSDTNYPRGDIRRIVFADGIGPYVKYDKWSGRITELRLSSMYVPIREFERSTGIDLPPTIGRLKMLKKLYLFNVCLLPKELLELVYLRVLRLHNCLAFSDHPTDFQLPGVLHLQVRICATFPLLKWITSCLPNIRSLEILCLDQTSLENVFYSLGQRGKSNSDGGQKPLCFRNSLVKLHISTREDPAYIPGLEEAVFGILENLPNLSKLYVERVAGRWNKDKSRIRNELELLMAVILDRYPRLRGLSIGGRNIFTFDSRQHHRRRLGNGSLAATKSYPEADAFCDVLLNLNRCGRLLLNQASTVPCRWIPVSVWSRVLERAQRIPYAGTVRTPKDRRIQEVGALYFLLRNGPALALREEFGFEFARRVPSCGDFAADGVGTSSAINYFDKPNKKTRRATRKRKYTCWK